MRGERVWPDVHGNHLLGSSPHARGTHETALGVPLADRFIPACAGNAYLRQRFSAPRPVHPRMRGERSASGWLKSSANGSSPHARGTLPSVSPSSSTGRFIPACAGNALRPASSVTVVCGSSPHARGTLDACCRIRQGLRFIPACAGNAVVIDRVPQRHPGSSPHARGTPVLCGDGHGGSRFIPACAGNAFPDLHPVRASAVHPRMRGERDVCTRPIPFSSGSSPHARGTRRRCPGSAPRHRFIPACAGNAPAARGRHTRCTVHPRMRGERATSADSRSTSAGSSPHARGTRFRARFRQGLRRFIPACAGNARMAPPIVSASAVHPRMRGERHSA